MVLTFRRKSWMMMGTYWAVGIGGYEPNEYEKEAQRRAYSEQCGALAKGVIQPPPAYDESKFKKYTAAYEVALGLWLC